MWDKYNWQTSAREPSACCWLAHRDPVDTRITVLTAERQQKGSELKQPRSQDQRSHEQEEEIMRTNDTTQLGQDGQQHKQNCTRKVGCTVQNALLCKHILK